MLGTGFLGGLAAKLAGLGSVAKAAIATATAALTMTVAGGAAGVLPFEGGHSGPAVTVTTAAQAATGDGTTLPATSADTDGQAAAETSPTTTAVSTSAGAVGSTEGPAGSTPSVATPPVPVPGTGLPDLSGLAHVPSEVLACFSPIVDLVKSLPGTPIDQLGTIGSQFAAIGPQIVACVTGIVADLPLPSGMNACIANIMSFVRSMASQLPTGTPGVGGLDLAACIPAGLPVPTGLPAGLPSMGGGFPFGH